MTWSLWFFQIALDHSRFGSHSPRWYLFWVTCAGSHILITKSWLFKAILLLDRIVFIIRLNILYLSFIFFLCEYVYSKCKYSYLYIQILNVHVYIFSCVWLHEGVCMCRCMAHVFVLVKVDIGVLYFALHSFHWSRNFQLKQSAVMRLIEFLLVNNISDYMCFLVLVQLCHKKSKLFSLLHPLVLSYLDKTPQGHKMIATAIDSIITFQPETINQRSEKPPVLDDSSICLIKLLFNSKKNTSLDISKLT